MIYKNIKEIIIPFLQQYGFDCKDDETSHWWEFEREAKGIKKYIIIDKSNRGNDLRLLFCTSKLCAGKEYELRHICEKYSNNYWWTFNGEEELRNILKDFYESISIYGFSALEILSQEPFEPANELLAELSFITTFNAELFRDEYNLEFENPTNSIQQLMQIIEDRKRSTILEKDFLLSAAAFWGELIRQGIGAKWGRHPVSNKYCLMEIGDRNETVSPIHDIVDYWFKGELCCHNLLVIYDNLNRCK